MDRVGAPESMSNPLNLVSLYRESVDELKTYGAGVTGEAVSSLIVIRCFNALSAKVLTITEDSELCSWPIEV